MGISSGFFKNIGINTSVNTFFKKKLVLKEENINLLKGENANQKVVKNSFFEKYVKNNEDLYKGNKLGYNPIEKEKRGSTNQKFLLLSPIFDLLFGYISKLEKLDLSKISFQKIGIKDLNEKDFKSILKNLNQKLVSIKNLFSRREFNNSKDISFQKLYSILEKKNIIVHLKQIDNILNKTIANNKLDLKSLHLEFKSTFKDLNQIISSSSQIEVEDQKNKLENKVEKFNRIFVKNKLEVDESEKGNLKPNIQKLANIFTDTKIEVNKRGKNISENKVEKFNKAIFNVEVNSKQNKEVSAHSKWDFSNGFNDLFSSLKNSKGHDVSNLKIFQSEKFIAKDIFNQVIQKIEWNGQSSKIEADIHLKPDFFGKSSLKIASDSENSLKGVLFVESFELKKILEAQIPYLKDKLSNLGFQISNFDVLLYQDNKNFQKNHHKFSQKVDHYNAYSLNNFQKFNESLSDRFLYGNYKVNLII